MARIRSVKPELRTSHTVAAWPREVRYFWVLLWGYLDDHGGGVDDLRLIKADAFPLDDDLTPAILDEWIDMFVASGSVCRYEIRGRRYLHAPSWSDHQKPSHAGKPKVPPCPNDHSTDASKPDTRETRAQSSGNPREDYGNPRETPRHAREENHAKVTEQLGVFARVSGDSPESSRDPRDTLAPEQVAGSREQGAAARARTRVHTREDPPPQPTTNRETDNAILAITDATDATESEARQLIASVMNRDDPPRNLPGFLRRLGADGDLAHMLTRLRADNRAANPATHAYVDPDDIGVCQHPGPNGHPCGLRDSHSRHRFVGTATVELRTITPTSTTGGTR